MCYGLTEQTIKQIRAVFKQHETVTEAILYGSRAKGNNKRGSDIDLTLKGNKLDLAVLNQIEQSLDELLLPYEIDLSIYEQIDNPDLIEHINRVGKPFYRR